MPPFMPWGGVRPGGGADGARALGATPRTPRTPQQRGAGGGGSVGGPCGPHHVGLMNHEKVQTQTRH